MTFGIFPEVTLNEARKEHLAVRTKLAGGANPSEKKKLEKLGQQVGLSNTFDKVATA